MDTLTHDAIRAAVRNRYGTIAETRGVSPMETAGVCCGSTSPEAGRVSCCGDVIATTLDAKDHAYGYSEDDTSAVPEGANLGLGHPDKCRYHWSDAGGGPYRLHVL